jgi:hypothetical protein
VLPHRPRARYRDRFTPKRGGQRVLLWQYGQDTTTCHFKGENVAQQGALMKQPRRNRGCFFCTGYMITACSDSKTSRHYLAGLPPSAVTGVNPLQEV